MGANRCVTLFAARQRMKLVDDRLRPSAELARILGADAEDLRYDLRRQRNRKLGDDVEFPVAGYLIDQRLGNCCNAGRQLIDTPLRECMRNEFAQPLVIGFILQEERRRQLR